MTTAVLGCPHTDEWPALDRAVAAVEAAVLIEDAPYGTDRTTADDPLAAATNTAGGITDVGGGGSRLASLRQLRGFLRAGSLLAARGLPLTVQHMSGCGREEAARCVRQVLGKVQR